MRTRVKICGITNPADALLAAEAGADAIGLVFHEPSPRNIEPAVACSIIDILPPFMDAYAVVLDPDPQFLDELIETIPFDGLQYHGQEAPELCARFEGHWIKAVPMNEPGALTDYQQHYPDAHGFLLDSHASGEAGGQGKTFDWTEIHSRRPASADPGGRPGGGKRGRGDPGGPSLGAVDVSSGVEASPGSKDPEKIAAIHAGGEPWSHASFRAATAGRMPKGTSRSTAGGSWPRP